MLLRKNVKLFLFAGVSALMLSGCASLWFPDFEDADKEVVVDDGGKVEVREVKEKGILVSDKENAAYEGTEEAQEAKEEVMATEVVEIKKEAEKTNETDTVKMVEDSFEEPLSEEVPHAPSMHYLAQTIYFENGGATVNASGQKELKEIAKLAKKNNALVTVYGFASSRTKNTDPVTHKLVNFKISAERAENTAKLLRRYGVDASRINVQALSDSMPLYQEVMPEGERLNRRAEIYLTY